jgi:glutamyl-tRNA reductase
MNRLFDAALRTGGRVRAETGVGAGRMSISTVAVDLAREAVGDLAARSVVIIGAGETAELTARALAANGVRTAFVANRHADRARSIARSVGGQVSSLQELPERIAEADVVVSSTSSPHPLISADALAEIVRDRDRPLVLIDIAVPRDIDAACAEIPGVHLYDIDDLQAVVERNLEVREAERAEADALVEAEIQRFARWLGQLDVLPTVTALREHGNAIVEQVLTENAGRWEGATPRDRERVNAMVRSVMQRLLHEPTIRLRSLDRDAAHGRLEMARELFGLLDRAPDAEDEPRADAEVRPLWRTGDS